jgi:hypothetical protein
MKRPDPERSGPTKYFARMRAEPMRDLEYISQRELAAGGGI